MMKQLIHVFSSICALIKKYGISNVLLSIVIGLLLFMNIQGNQSKDLLNLFKQTEITKEANHEKGQIQRANTQLEIYNIIEKIGYKYGADRVFIGEYHNGDINMDGLPFKYFGITYESILSHDINIKPISEQYKDVPATLFRFVDYIYKHRYFCGDLKNVFEVDKLLAFKLGDNFASYIFICGIRSSDNKKDLGFFGMTFSKNISKDKLENILEEKNNIIFDMRYAGADISKLLNFEK